MCKGNGINEINECIIYTKTKLVFGFPETNLWSQLYSEQGLQFFRKPQTNLRRVYPNIRGEKMQEATIYTTLFCPYCVRAKNLLAFKKVVFKEIDITGNDTKLQELTQKTGMETVPQIWIGATFVGGFDDLNALEKSGKLDGLLGK